MNEKIDCCGCSACAEICPRGCIEMKRDEEGFAYPVKKEESCTECGLCSKVCPCIHTEKADNRIPKAYACINEDEEVRMSSSSGGIFSLLAKYVLSQGGKVYGAAFDADWNVNHISVESEAELYKLRGSKYLQSDMNATYSQVKNDLEQGRTVLFTGTTCQAAGLKNFLHKKYDNLYLVDFVCHGVPSPLVWEKYLYYIKELRGGVFDRESMPSFRSKAEGWHRYSVSIPFIHDAEYLKEHDEDLYMKIFLQNINLRPSCYDCKFKPSIAYSDITLADFWGINKFFPEMNDDKGVSLVMLNNKKGEQLFHEVSGGMQSKEVSYEKVIPYNTSIVKSVECPPKRDEFFRELKKCEDRELRKLMEKVTRISIFRRIIGYAKRCILKLFTNIKGLRK